MGTKADLTEDYILRNFDAILQSADTEVRTRPIFDCAQVWYSRFNEGKRLEDLCEAVHRARRAIAEIPRDHDNFATYSATLSDMLVDKGKVTSSMADIDEAIRKGTVTVRKVLRWE
ncbi:hypothetical protein AJ80_03558 [Polytolypa hystricis UAMH7299]|uniref:Uncharacterized protein n=1 Tax=Polytolypa hystricis (strain UAMH7299) TaxID=1447883 RepID=A0A2B7YHB4_POLH7|nr:hypothetical protein AJ80_03558 [Polytolypa hystricis UAMH7299]